MAKSKQKIQTTHDENMPYLTYTLIALNLIVYLFVENFNGWSATYITLFKYGLSDLTLNTYGLWQIVTSMFVHINLLHLLLNLVGLFSFGRALESIMGTKRFAILYFGAGFFGAMFAVLFSPTMIVVGASGAIFGMLGLYCIISPLSRIKLFYIFKIPSIIFCNSPEYLHILSPSYTR